MFVFYDLYVQVNIISRTSNGDMRAASARAFFCDCKLLVFLDRFLFVLIK